MSTNTRIEIFKNGVWTNLILKENKAVKYNVVINKIGSMSKREISHSNTFELPYIHHNIQALGINVFNKSDLAKAFNARHLARYYVDEKLTQKGYLIINNTGNGAINVNLIDEALQIIDSWGSMTYYDLLNTTDVSIKIPDDYKLAILEMKNYEMTMDEILLTLGTVGTRGYGIAKFPNNLNAIGEKFQINKDGVRPDNTFNPYQSRPIFNVKALFDIAIESFGYTPIFDPSVDWERLKLTYMIDKDLSQSQKGDNSAVIKPNPVIASNSPAIMTYPEPVFGSQKIRTLFVYPEEVNALTPNQVGWDFNDKYSSELFYDRWYDRKDYKNLDRAILKPDTSVSFSGYMQWKYIGAIGQVRALWRTTPTIFGSIMEVPLTFDENNSADGVVDVKINKTQLSIPPVGALEFIGIIYILETISIFPPVPDPPLFPDTADTYRAMYNLSYIESYLQEGTVSYDQYDQYEAFNINLTHAAPRETIKDLLSAVMQKEGILMSFQNDLKQVKLFTYGSYITRKVEGNFDDWSIYYQESTLPNYNTDYGNEYAKKNEVGLMTPFKGNTITVNLENQGTESKYKDFTQNLSKKFKDIEGVKFIQNSITPYFEYINKGLGLVEVSTIGLGSLTQVRADGTTQGTFSGLTQVYNVNCLNLPDGLIEWYELIDESVKCEATFILPVEKIREVDMSQPIYIEGLGGFYIIEEIQEYINSQTPVKIKLIKMIIPFIEVSPEIDDHMYDEFSYDDTFYE